MNTTLFGTLIKEYFAEGFLSEHDKATCKLVNRYWDKVSPRLKEAHARLIAEGDKDCKAYIQELLLKPSPFMEAVAKNHSQFESKGFGFFGPIDGD